MTTKEAYRTASELLTDLKKRNVSAVELAKYAIERIEKVDTKLNAVVVRDFDRALEAASAADAARAHGADRPLLGLPMTVKEANDVAGLRTTWGFPGFKDFVAAEDSVAIGRLKAAGAVILGKTNVAMLLADWQSSNPLYGRTNNPWDMSRTSGGSTGGAAAVASGMVPLEFGSDLAGSIRVPAAFCGVYGLKPSHNIVPLHGFKPPPAPQGTGIPITALGPLARSPDDIELMLRVLAGPDAMDVTGYGLALPKARHDKLSAFRVLVVDFHPAAELDNELGDALHTFGARLEKFGTTVLRQSALLPDPMETLSCFGKILGTVTSRGGPPQAQRMSAHDWMDTLDLQYVIRRKWAVLFESFDIVLAPAFGVAAFPHIEVQDKRTLTINGKSTPYETQGAWSSTAGLANLPALAMPIGLTRTGLPISVQIIGPYLEDHSVIQFARLCEQQFGGFRPPPGF